MSVIAPVNRAPWSNRILRDSRQEQAPEVVEAFPQALAYKLLNIALPALPILAAQAVWCLREQRA